MGQDRGLSADDNRAAAAEPNPSEPTEGSAATRHVGILERRRREPGDLLPMKWLGVGLPIVLLIAIECFRYLVVEDSPVHRAEHVAIAAITAVGIVLPSRWSCSSWSNAPSVTLIARTVS